MKIRDIIESDELKKAMKKPPTASKQSDETKAQIQAYKDKRFGTKAEQKAKSDKLSAEVKDAVKDAGPWTSGGKGSLD